MSEDKTYTESEVSAILGRAARLQASRMNSDDEKLTLDEIKKAAREAGIDERFIEVAASSSSDYHDSYLTIPTGVGRSLFVRGRLDDKIWNEMTALFTREFGGPGKTEKNDRRRVWTLDSLHITADDVNGQIVLHAKTEWARDLEMPIALSIVASIAAMMVGALAVVSQEWMIGILAVIFTILVVGSFTTFRNRISQKKKRNQTQIQAVLDRCSEIVITSGSHRGKTDDIVEEKIGLPEVETGNNKLEGSDPKGNRRAKQR